MWCNLLLRQKQIKSFQWRDFGAINYCIAVLNNCSWGGKGDGEQGVIRRLFSCHLAGNREMGIDVDPFLVPLLRDRNQGKT